VGIGAQHGHRYALAMQIQDEIRALQVDLETLGANIQKTANGRLTAGDAALLATNVATSVSLLSITVQKMLAILAAEGYQRLPDLDHL
jgi:hypothetical protein